MSSEDLDFLKKVVYVLAEIGNKYGKSKGKNDIPLHRVGPFKYFCSNSGNLKQAELNQLDGPWTRRELIARYLLLNVVLDQGPDIPGVRELIVKVTNALYRREIRIFHRPIDFFKELNISIDEILEKHNSVKNLRAEEWARANNTTPSKYNLFFAQSPRGIISINQVLDYSIHRWGVPLCVPLLLEKDMNENDSLQPFVDYLESFASSEEMSRKLKEHERYGLGSAIGYKACHLFAKWYIHTFGLSTRADEGWSKWSYEMPLDSNAGRVLFRMGVLQTLASMDDFKKWQVIQERKGKKNTNYIRVTNLRGKPVTQDVLDDDIYERYSIVVTRHMKMKQTIRKIEIQRIFNALLVGSRFGIGDLDDGLIYIGTNFCYNHDRPLCRECPVYSLCIGRRSHPEWIKEYTT